MQTQMLDGGFTDPARDAAHAFRAVMEAMARPATTWTLRGATPPAPLSPAAGAVVLTLCDTDTPLFLAGAMDCDAVRGWIAFHTGAPLTDRTSCAFALGAWDDLAPLEGYPAGTPDYPDRSTTLIVDGPLPAAARARLTGPGIASEVTMTLPDLAALERNAARFPLGVDLLFTQEDRVTALPRSTKVEPA